jgi:hypothetical protein
MDLGLLFEEITSLSHEGCRYRAIEMRIAASFVIERVENCEAGWPLLDGKLRDCPWFSVHQRHSGTQKVGDLLFLSRLRL